jgi:UDP-N-acetylmuramate--alanine ligase
MKPVVTYGFSPEWDFSARDIQVQGLGTQFEVYSRSAQRVLGSVRLQVPGEHNVLNALATIAVGTHIGIPFEKIVQGLWEFRGVKRRFEIRWEDRTQNQVIVDDYGHHPTEIAATLAAARSYWKGRILTVFQPHRYSRTLHCKDGFLSAFRKTDGLWITDIYSAGEEPIEGVSSLELVSAIRKVSDSKQKIEYGGSIDSARDALLKEIKPGDLVLCCGAGSITQLPQKLIDQLSQGKS